MKVEIIRSTIVCIKDNKILGFNAEDPYSLKRFFFLPGGKIEKNETIIDCAIRETLEETGYRVKPIKESGVLTRYQMTWAGKIQSCATYFYYAELDERFKPSKSVADASYHRGVAWVDIKKIATELSYSQKIQETTLKLLKLYGKS